MDLLFDLITLPFDIISGGMECVTGCVMLLLVTICCVGAGVVLYTAGVF